MRPMKIVFDEIRLEVCRHGTAEFPFARYHEVISACQHPEINWHWHREVEFLYVEANTVLCYVGSKKILLSKNEGIFINSNVLHGFESTDGGIIPNFLFLPEFIAPAGTTVFRRYVEPLVTPESTPFVLIKDRSMIELLKEIWHAASPETEMREIKVHRLSEKLWETLYPIVHQNRKRKTDLNRSPVGYRVQSMLGYIYKNYGKEIQLEDIAAAANISQSEALRCFHALLHTTPIKYLVDYRLKAAAEKLKTEHIRISAAAEACGFRNASYFCRAFRKKYGLSPAQFRSRMDREREVKG
jgi:AraC-like DNA-binding protein